MLSLANPIFPPVITAHLNIYTIYTHNLEQVGVRGQNGVNLVQDKVIDLLWGTSNKSHGIDQCIQLVMDCLEQVILLDAFQQVIGFALTLHHGASFQ
jgi:hypothetical protein